MKIAATISDYQGFTLVELIMTIVIMGILAGIAVPQFSEKINNMKVKEAVTTMELAIKEAKSQAFITQRNTKVTIDLNTADADQRKRFIVALISPDSKVAEYTINNNVTITSLPSDLVSTTTNKVISFNPRQAVFNSSTGTGDSLGNAQYLFCIQNQISDRYILNIDAKGNTRITSDGSCS